MIKFIACVFFEFLIDILIDLLQQCVLDLLVIFSLQAVSVIDASLHTNPTTTTSWFEFLSADI